MEQYKVLVVDNVPEVVRQILESLKKMGIFYRCLHCFEGNSAAKMIEEEQPDLLITEIMLPGIDGYGLVELAREKISGVKCIIHSWFSSEYVMKTAFQMGIDYYLMKPINADILERRVREVMATKEVCLTEQSLEQEVSRVLQKLGICASNKGYRFLRSAIIRVILDKTLLESITSRLYKEIAAEFETNGNCVERNMRHAIEAAWNRGNMEVIDSVFGYTVDAEKGKPTNSAFIATVADHIRLKRGKVD